MIYFKFIMLATVLSTFQNNVEDIGPRPAPPLSGTCIKADGSATDLSNVEILLNKEVSYEIDGATKHIIIDGDYARVFDSKKYRKPYKFLDIRSFVSPEIGLDIKVSHARIDNYRYIYWSETFLNRANKQGILIYDGKNLTTYCSGSYGYTIER